MSFSPKDAYKLFHQGSLALSQIESNGIRIDTELLDKSIEEMSSRIIELQHKFKESDLHYTWKELFGPKTKLSSRLQLSKVLQSLGHDSNHKTKTGRLKTDEESLSELNLPILSDFLQIEKLKKAKTTYLEGIRNEVVDGFLHPVFNLHTVETQRSSSSDPNFQNIPIRNKEIGSIIRKCFLARLGHCLVEIDYKALEFKIAACFWKDSEMIKYASDPIRDIHRDMAAKIFIVDKKQVNKECRFYTKNQFVFPILYGSWWKVCARNLWESIGKFNLKVGETPMKDWLMEKGIDRLTDDRGEFKTNNPAKGTFEAHIREVEQSFYSQFSTFKENKDRWWKDFLKTGCFRMMTGFPIQGDYSKNFIMNCPIQGPGFHCLLWSLTKLQKEIRKKKMKSLLVGQIHDCMLGDVVLSEIQEFISLAEHIMTVEVRKLWDWIIVPLEIEVDVTPEGGTWYDKKPWGKRDGVWECV